MGSKDWSGRRIAGVAGIGFAVLIIATFLFGGDGPTYDATASEAREYFVGSDTQVHLTTWIGALATVFFLLPFAAGLRNVLASAERPDEPMWSRLSYSGAVLAAAIAGIGSTFWEVLSQGTAEGLPDETVVALARFDTVIFLGLLPWGLALMLASASLVILRSAVLARWIGWLGAVAAALLVVGTLWIFSEDSEAAIGVLSFFGTLLTVLWVVAAGVALIRSGARATAAVPGAAVAGEA